jgi:O-6-methylguanine DNA methyltransferase
MTTDQTVVEFPLGSFRATVDDGVVRSATFDPTPQPVRRDRFGVYEVLEAYFAGEVTALDSLTVETRGTPFQQEVWRGLRRIPVGTTISYGELARRVGRPNAQRAVGMANAANPVTLIVPCHRVIRTGGALGGYAFGLDYKRWLLAHEAPARGLPSGREPIAGGRADRGRQPVPI